MKLFARKLFAFFVIVVLLGAAGLSFSCQQQKERKEKKSSAKKKKAPQGNSENRSDKLSTPISAIPVFNTQQALNYVKYLSVNIGPRRQATSKEAQAASYIKDEFNKMGYSAQTQVFTTPLGTSQNVIARKEGQNPNLYLVVGAHYDTKTTDTPGADDNASGVATVLTVASLLRNYPLYPSIVFVAFGAEEMADNNKDHHHYGSRYYVSQMSTQEKNQTLGMISVDMIGFGPDFNIRSLGIGSRVIIDNLIVESTKVGHPAAYLKSGEISDHEAFEKAGIPSAWLEWRDDSAAHTPGDTLARIKPDHIDVTGKMLLNFLLSFDQTKTESLKR